MIEDARPYFPYIWVVMECGSGLILHLDMSKRDGCETYFQEKFLSLMEGLPIWPKRIKYRKDIVEKIFGPSAKALGIEMVKCDRLENVEMMRKDFESKMNEG